MTLLFVLGCGRVETGRGPGSVASGAQSPPTPSPGQMYMNSQYGFSFSYRTDFTVEVEANTAHAAELFAARVVDSSQVGTYPRGQVFVRVFQVDTSDLHSWVMAHTGPCPAVPCNDSYYWQQVSNLTDTRFNGKLAVRFDYVVSGPLGSAPALHATAFLHHSNLILDVEWTAQDSTYGSTIQGLEQDLLASLQEQ
jgi:hypothetical protein